MSPKQAVTKQSGDPRDPDDRKEGERAAQVGRRDRGEYEDVEDARAKSRRDDEDLEEIDDADIVEQVDLDAAPDGDGPDA